jgi:MarR family transcriptional regulator for hemolysin
VARRADPANRRVQRVELTPDGEAAFDRLRKVAVGFDQRLRKGLDEAEVDALRATLERLAANVAGD